MISVSTKDSVWVLTERRWLYDVEQSAQNNLVDAGHGSDEDKIELVKKFNQTNLSKLTF